MTSIEEALDIVLKSVEQPETERAGIINTLGRTLADDVFAGDDLLIPAGAIIGVFEMGLLASEGKQSVVVTSRPRVSVVTTGDELVDLMERLETGNVRNSNRYTFAGHVFSSGCELGRLLHVPNNPVAFRKAVESTRSSDAVITTGGTAPDQDFCVVDVLDGLGDVLFRKVAMMPGETMAFAIVGGKPVFALPGDPVAAAVVFEIVVRPALNAMLGRRPLNRRAIPAVLKDQLHHSSGRRGFVHGLARSEEGRLVVRSIIGRHSTTHRTLVDANCLIVVPEEKGNLEAGEQVQVILTGSL